jgi:hypothetical protein
LVALRLQVAPRHNQHQSKLMISLLHAAVRNPGVHEFLPVSFVSQTRIELPCMRLGVHEEILDVFQIRGSFNSGDQHLANTKTSIRLAHGHPTYLGGRAVIAQYNTRSPYRLSVSQRDEMQSFTITLIALQIDRNLLFDDKDLFSDPKTLI